MPDANSNVAMSFHGEFDHGVDSQRRLQIPADWRPTQEDARFILLPWEYPSGICIRVLTPARLDEMLAAVNAMPNDNPKKIQLKRYIGTNSCAVALDKSGRVCIPAGLAAKAGINGKVKLVSLIDRFELWDPVRYIPVAESDMAVAPDATRYLG